MYQLRFNDFKYINFTTLYRLLQAIQNFKYKNGHIPLDYRSS